jgi:hypothetical protein
LAQNPHRPMTLRAIARGGVSLPDPIAGDAYLPVDLAEALGVHVAAIHRWCREGRMTAILRGGYRVILAEDAKRFVAGGATTNQRRMGNRWGRTP